MRGFGFSTLLKGFCTATLFVAPLFTMEVPNLGVMEMEQAWNHRKPFRACCLALVSHVCLWAIKGHQSSETVWHEA